MSIPNVDQVITPQSRLNTRLLHEDELALQTLWYTYFSAISIKERTNLKQQARCMPRRFWHLLPEMYSVHS